MLASRLEALLKMPHGNSHFIGHLPQRLSPTLDIGRGGFVEMHRHTAAHLVNGVMPLVQIGVWYSIIG